MQNTPHIIIIGGGLAGIACATALAAHPLRITLIESRSSLGGRASSFIDPDSGEEIDNCQHVLVGCCTNLLDLYKRLNVSDKIAWSNAIHFLDPHGRQHNLKSTPGLPAPLQFAPAFATYGLFTLKEKIAVNRAMRAALSIGKSGREKLTDLPFGEWLDQHNQPASLIPKYYEPILLGALNENIRAASTKYALQVFQDAMLAHRRGALFGVATCPLSQLYKNLPANITVQLNTRADEILFDANRATGIKLRDGRTLFADAVVLATNHHAVQRWIPAQLAATDSRFAGLSQINAAPILGTHLVFDRPVMHQSHVALIAGPLQWLFKKDPDGRVLAGVISAAQKWVEVPREKALQEFVAHIKQMFPAARDANLLRGTTVIERRATISPVPGIDKLRPQQSPPAGGLSNLYLAGDYTQTHWPSTMEGAVRAGYLAAEALLQQLNATPTRLLIPDLPIEWPARLLGLAK